MHKSKNKYATDSISILPITERSVRSDEIIELNIRERSYAIDTRIINARTRDRAFAHSIGVFISHVPGCRV